MTPDMKAQDRGEWDDGMKTLILLAAPNDDGYYDDMAEAIIKFHIEFAKKIKQAGDEVIILTNDKYHSNYASKLPQELLFHAPMADIWMRDFTLVENRFMFRYSSTGQGGLQDEADFVQYFFIDFIHQAGLDYISSQLINDGGNFVSDGYGRFVISTKFLKDNDLTPTQARDRLARIMGAKEIAFIQSDEQGGLEHADGVVSFIGENQLIINDYPDDPAYQDRLINDLRAGLPSVHITAIPTPYDGEVIYDERFGSACGLYVNALVTKTHIYLPQFNMPTDETVLKQLKTITDKQIIPIQSHPICIMGGGVRCMSLQITGENAKKLLAYIHSHQ